MFLDCQVGGGVVVVILGVSGEICGYYLKFDVVRFQQIMFVVRSGFFDKLDYVDFFVMVDGVGCGVKGGGGFVFVVVGKDYYNVVFVLGCCYLGVNFIFQLLLVFVVVFIIYWVISGLCFGWVLKVIFVL